ncbi:MAG: nitronate monooxygenase [Anaerolineae bacterium]|nr:nitronate monooxygenase [Anaerolineae bacterium]
MAFQITRAGKGSLILETPVMPAAGTMGFADEYKGLIKLEKLGALVTNPVTLYPRSPASGTRVVALEAGVLVHSGLPNAGLAKVLSNNVGKWRKMSLPIILHLVATSADDVQRACSRIDEEEDIDAVELGIGDETSVEEVARLVRAAEQLEKPLIARVPYQDALPLARACADAGADAVVVCSAPRGTARDSSGRLISGRVYGPLIRPMTLRLVGQIVRALSVPVIGAGGIHTAQDARDYLEAGAVAVQVDSAVWVQPKTIEIIARDLGGLVLTQPSGAFADEWHEGMGQTEANQRVEPSLSDVIPRPQKPKKD